jgi:hypothetical protein
MSWQDKTDKFCKKYNIPLEYLADTLNEPKVIPMIRGKAFEFSVYQKLQGILDSATWEVQKNVMNAQLGIHDEDVTVKHISSDQTFGGECKLAGKGRYKINKDGSVQINIKCMRSRTLGPEMVKKLAPKYGIEEAVLAIHNDQYLPSDFDMVITSIGNAFYQTDDDGLMYWDPTEDEKTWLKFICDTEDEENLQDAAFNKIYVISSHDLSIRNDGYQTCTRRKCENKENCGFIPNYPTLTFPKDSRIPSDGWTELSNIENVLNQLL